ncbi:MAG: PhzF family phenazine biosynthesis protein [Gammaproteobacteria bacterium]
MKLPFFQLDAFVEGPFTGNPAAVCVLPGEVEDARLQAVAAENNLSETAFLRQDPEGWRIRWFTPACEVALCGHATLAAGAVVLDHLEPDREGVTFESLSGPLGVARSHDLLELDFPAWERAPAEPAVAAQALGAVPSEAYAGKYFMAVYDSREAVAALAPDPAAVSRVPALGVIATAPGVGEDFVSRFFAPRAGVAEDPVTGSAHCMLAPYWAARLGRPRLEARQLSVRGGWLVCTVSGDRVRIAGRTRLVIEGSFRLDAD